MALDKGLSRLNEVNSTVTTRDCEWKVMVREKKMNDRTVYVCEICGLGYADRETANECEEWCRKTGTCSLKITRKAVYVPNLFEDKSESS